MWRGRRHRLWPAMAFRPSRSCFGVWIFAASSDESLPRRIAKFLFLQEVRDRECRVEPEQRGQKTAPFQVDDDGRVRNEDAGHSPNPADCPSCREVDAGSLREARPLSIRRWHIRTKRGDIAAETDWASLVESGWVRSSANPSLQKPGRRSSSKPGPLLRTKSRRFHPSVSICRLETAEMFPLAASMSHRF